MTEHAKEVMKKCQIGFGNYPNALQDANNLLAECYGTIGKLSAEIAELKAAAQNLVKVIDSAGLKNLMDGVQLGQVSWYFKADDAINYMNSLIKPE